MAIDVRPGNPDNTIVLHSKGKVPVAVLGAADFDVSGVDESTVLFAGAPPVKHGTLDDVSGDGIPDLQFLFNIQDLMLETDKACLTGAMQSSQPFRGCDLITIK